MDVWFSHTFLKGGGGGEGGDFVFPFYVWDCDRVLLLPSCTLRRCGLIKGQYDRKSGYRNYMLRVLLVVVLLGALRTWHRAWSLTDSAYLLIRLASLRGCLLSFPAVISTETVIFYLVLPPPPPPSTPPPPPPPPPPPRASCFFFPMVRVIV